MGQTDPTIDPSDRVHYLREKAKECRLKAEAATSNEGQITFLSLADLYEDLARQVEQLRAHRQTR